MTYGEVIDLIFAGICIIGGVGIALAILKISGDYP